MRDSPPDFEQEARQDARLPNQAGSLTSNRSNATHQLEGVAAVHDKPAPEAFGTGTLI